MTDSDLDQRLPDEIVPDGTGYMASRLNALQHGVLSRYTVLPWEEPTEYDALLQSLADEHAPVGPTEAYLVEELAGVLWRKRRLRLAEAATYRRALQATTDTHRGTARAALVLTARSSAKVDVSEALRHPTDSGPRELAEIEADRNRTLAALASLKTDDGEAYHAALAMLDESTREAWQDQLTWEPGDYEAGATPFAVDAPSLKRYLEEEIMPWYEEQRAQIVARPIVRAQALGESLDPDKLERLGRYEVHLDRKFERTLSTLIRLQELRRTKPSAAAQA